MLFDAYGTLLELDDPVGNLTRELAAAGYVYGADRVAAAFRAEVDVYRRHHDQGRDIVGLETLQALCAEAFVAALPVPPPVDVATEILTGSLRYRMFADVIPALDAVAARGLRCAVVSNWDCSLPAVLAQLGIAERFAMVSVSAVMGFRKPDPRIFEHALAALGVQPEQAIHVGDDPRRDVDGARSAGLRAVLIDRSAEAADVDCERVADLRSLTALLG